MASVSPQGERSVLALLADLYAQNINLREQLAAAERELTDLRDADPEGPTDPPGA